MAETANTLVASRQSLVAEKWRGCYGGRGDLFTPESNRHPAKMAVPLCYRIFEHGRQRGYWKPATAGRAGDWILDPMAGIGTTLVCGYSLGYNVVGVELEEHFVRLLAVNMTRTVDRVDPRAAFRIIQGDARDLSNALAAALDREVYSGAVTSPPFSDMNRESDLRSRTRQLRESGHLKGFTWHYDGAVTSPPYADQDVTASRQFSSRHQPERPTAAALDRDGYQGGVSSPPYPSEFREQHPGTEGGQVGLEFERGGSFQGYSGAISSPPYHSELDYKHGLKTLGPNFRGRKAWQECRNDNPCSQAQIGNLRDPAFDICNVLRPPLNGTPAKDTYLGAIAQVYAQLYQVLKPGGVVCLVTKNPIKKGKIRRLDLDTIRLMEHCGFSLIERQMAMLAEEHPAQFTLAGEVVERRTERKSFFKRLFEAKNPHLRVDHEDVLWFRKLAAATETQERGE